MDHEKENIAETLVKALPRPELLLSQWPETDGFGGITHFAVPKGFEIKSIDSENLLSRPRRAKAAATLSDTDSFIEYVKRHAGSETVVWCDFNPQTFALSFKAVIDEHGKGEPGWRGHTASYKPDMSPEWKLWKAGNETSMDQMSFAEFIEANADDFVSAEGMPTSLEMLAMATDFHANEERVLKSKVRLQSGGVRLTYIADPESGNTEDVKIFNAFSIGIPAFQGGSAWRMTARLKYRLNAGRVSFHYELVRPDRIHNGAAKEMIDVVRAAVEVPVLMGFCN